MPPFIGQSPARKPTTRRMRLRVAAQDTSVPVIFLTVGDDTTVTEGIYPLLGIGVSESVQLNVLLFPSKSDATTVTELVALNVILMPNVSDSTTVTEVQTVNVVRCPQVNDATTVTDAQTVNVVRCPQVSDATTVTDSVGLYILLSPRVSDSTTVTESVTVARSGGGVLPTLTISVFDWAMLSNLAQPNETVTVTESVSATVAVPTTRSINLGEDIIVHDDGQGLALQGGPGALILILAVDNVGLSKLIYGLSETTTVTESTAMTIATPGAGPAIQMFETVTVSEQVWAMPDDYVFVTESVSVYFRQVNTTAFDAVTIAELTTLLIQGGSGAKVLLNVNDSVAVTESVTFGIPFLASVADTLFITEGSTVIVPKQPQPFDAVTVTDVVTLRLSFLAVNINEAVTVVDAVVDVRFSRLLITISESVSIGETSGIGRPSAVWEAAPLSVSTWDSVSSSSGLWQPGAVETGVWS